MKKTNLLKIATFAFAASLLAGVYNVTDASVVSADDETLPSCEIAGENLSLEDNIYILYAVDFQNVTTTDETGLLVWTTPQESYVYATANSVLSASSTVTRDGVVYPTFSYTELSAKQMTDVVYASAYVKREDTYYYSAVEKYSILEYAYDKLDKTEAEKTDDENLKNLLNGMLNYGALAQTYFNYRADSLATDAFTYVCVENAHFADGFDYGLFKTGTTVNVYPDDGYCLSVSATDFTEDENGDITFTIPETKFVDTTSFVEEKKTSEGLKYTLLSDDTYSIKGIGTCTDTDVIIPSTYEGKAVTSIGSSAFRNCSSLTSVKIPDGVTSIGSSAFYGCSALTSVMIGGGVTDIGYTVFGGCSSLMSINVSKNNTTFSSVDGILYDKEQTRIINIPLGISGSIAIPDSVTEIDGSTFSSCGALTNISVSDNNENYKSIDGNLYDKSGTTLIKYAAGKTKALFVVPDGVTSIGDYAFYMCKGLTGITIPNSVTSIGNKAFYGCSGLTSVTIPDSVTSIGEETFEYCNSLTIVVIGNGVNSIADRTFASCGALASVVIGESVRNVSCYAFWQCHSLTNISVSKNNAYYKSVDGNLYSKDGTKLVQYAIGKTMTAFVTPDGVTSIGDSAFYRCDNLVSVTIGDSVASIGSSAFSGCSSLTSITIGEGMTSIDYMAFDGCGGLTNIYISDMAVWCNISGLENIMTRGVSNKNLYLNGVLVTELIIPDSVTSIGDYAFKGINITSVVIGNGVTKICTNAFLNCNNLASVYYKSTESEWNKISVGYNMSLKNATRYYYSETQPTSTGNYWHYDENGNIVVW